MSLWIKAKLKPFEDIVKGYKYGAITKSYTVNHSCGDRNASLTVKKSKWPENIVDIKMENKKHNRMIYKIKGIGGRSFYDEWFSWTNSPPEHIPAELWDIGDW